MDCTSNLKCIKNTLKKQAKEQGKERRERKERGEEQTFSDDRPTNRDIIVTRESLYVYTYVFFFSTPAHGFSLLATLFVFSRDSI